MRKYGLMETHPTIDIQAEARCKACNKPIQRVPGRRPREFCNATCRQRYHRHPGVIQVYTDGLQLTNEHYLSLQAENDALRAAAQKLVSFFDQLQNVREAMRTDTKAHNFKLWLRTRGIAYTKRPWAQCLLDDPNVPLRSATRKNETSKSGYLTPMRMSDHYTNEDMQEFEEAWEAMWWDELFGKQYVTIRDSVLDAIETVERRQEENQP